MEILISESFYEAVEQAVSDNHGKPVTELSFQEAGEIAVGLFMAMAGTDRISGWFRDEETGRVVVDAEQDGQAAMFGRMARFAEEYRTTVKSEPEIIITVTRSDAGPEQPSQVIHQFHFPNDALS